MKKTKIPDYANLGRILTAKHEKTPALLESSIWFFDHLLQKGPRMGEDEIQEITDRMQSLCRLLNSSLKEETEQKERRRQHLQLIPGASNDVQT